MSTWLEALIALLLVIGGFFSLAGAIGLWRFPGFFARMHAPTMGTTMGLLPILLASMLWHGVAGDGFQFREVLIFAFLVFTAPIAAHLMGKAALSIQLARDASSGQLAIRDDQPQKPAD